MIIDKLDDDEAIAFIGSGLERSSAADTGKLHLSDIAKYIDFKMKFTKMNTQARKWNLMAAAEMGFLWEDVLSLMLGKRYAMRIGEIEKDGIVCSPDGVSPIDPYGYESLVNEEYKATWKSINKPPEDNWYWMTQFKSYDYVLGVNVTILRVLYINGDYKGSGPLPAKFRLQYSERELVENWQMICNARDEMMDKGYFTVHEAIKDMGEDL